MALGALVHPSVLLLGIQSALIGVVLTVVIALTQRLVEGRRPGPAFVGESGALAPIHGAGSTLTHTAGLGSDDSTAVRARPVSTMDYVPASPGVSSREGTAGSSLSQTAVRGSDPP